MGRIGIFAAAAALLSVAGCGEKPAPVEEAAASLSGGLYELTAEVTEVAATGKGAPGTALKLGDKQVVKACVSDGGKPTTALLAEDPGDRCEFKSSYIRNGRLSAQMNCTRKGQSGAVAPAIDGNFKADSFEGSITTATYMYGGGDYRLVRKVSAKRIGDCPPEEATKKVA
jgi:hypothetical protein